MPTMKPITNKIIPRIITVTLSAGMCRENVEAMLGSSALVRFGRLETVDAVVAFGDVVPAGIVGSNCGRTGSAAARKLDREADDQ